MASTNPPSSSDRGSAPSNAPVPSGGPDARQREHTEQGAVSVLALGRLGRDQQIARRVGARAEVQTLQSQWRAARQRGDTEAEGAAAARLARCLMAKGTRWAEAMRLARRSLLLLEDPPLREELSSWFASLAQFELAAATLEPLLERPLPALRRAALGQRIAVLTARAGDARRAALALKLAADADPQAALAPEMVAVLHGWAPEVIGRRVASRALLEASRRHASLDEARRAFDGAVRAFDTDPTHLPAAQELADRLLAAGRTRAADEVWRHSLVVTSKQHAHVDDVRHAHLDDVTWRRMTQALRSEQPLLALGAALDAEHDRRLDGEALWEFVSLHEDFENQATQPTFDGLLLASGFGAWLAARLRLQAAHAPSEARWWQALARVYSNVLQDDARASEAWSEALVRDPQQPVAVSELWRLARAAPPGEPGPLVAALRRAARHGPKAWRQRALEQLIRLAEQQVVAARVGLWAGEQLRRSVALPEPVAQRLAALEAQGAAPPEETRNANWEELSIEVLRERVEPLLHDPASTESALSVLEELSRREPGELRWYVSQAGLLRELGRLDALEALWRQGLERGLSDALACSELVSLYLERGAPRQALQLLEQLKPKAPRLTALRVALASLHGTRRQRADALVALAESQPGPQRSLLLAVASSDYLVSGERVRARDCARSACHSDPESARAIVCSAEARLGEPDRLALIALETAVRETWPRQRFCRALAEMPSSLLAARRRRLWLRRWGAMEPGSQMAARALLSELVECGDAAELVAAFDWIVSVPRPLNELADALLRVAERLAELDPARCRGVVQRLLGLLGVDAPGVSERFANLAEQLGEPRLLVALLERRCAQHPDAPEHVAWLLQIGECHARAGDGDAATEALWRALDAGADVAEVVRRLEALPPRTGSDAQLAELQIRVRFAQTAAEEPARVATAYRELGAAFWDLAGDREQATAAFARGAELDAAGGDATLVRDLIAFFGYPDAVVELRRLAQQRARPSERARLLLVAAQAAFDDGFIDQAKPLAVAALHDEPVNTEALRWVERCSGDGDSALLEECYAAVDQAALGRFGVRALHYRAARQFEARGELERAFQHAQAAFGAVPSEGRLLGYSIDLARRAGDARAAAPMLRRAATGARSAAERQRWLGHAAALEARPKASSGVSGQESREAASAPPPAEPSPRALQVEQARVEQALVPLRGEGSEALLAADALERSLASADWTQHTRARVFAELRQIYVREGAGEHLERLLTNALEANWLGLAQRSEAARELAELLDRRGAHVAALDVLGLLERWGSQQLRDVRRGISMARTAGERPREQRYLMQLERETDEAGERRASLRRLAELRLAEGQREGAREALFALLELAPGDPRALEVLIDEVERGEPAPWWDVLENHLSQQRGPADVARRLARSYAQQDHGTRPARALVERVLEQHPADVDLLETLADLAAREQDWAVAGEASWRAARQCRQARRAAQLAAQAAHAHLQAGDLDAAGEVLAHQGSYPETPALVEQRVELARRRRDDLALGAALERLSELSVGPASERAAPLIEASTMALNGGDWERALERARRAARMAPTDARAQLQAKWLEYRQRGPGNRETALQTISELRGVRSDDPALVELKAFLLAEALEQRAASGSGLRELREAEARVGARPLIALGIAERLVPDDPRALDYYEQALCGDLRGFRDTSAVARAAAGVAERCQRPELVERFTQWGQLPASPPADGASGCAEAGPTAEPKRRSPIAVQPPVRPAERVAAGATRLGMGPASGPRPLPAPTGAAPGAALEAASDAGIDTSAFEAAQRALEATVSAPPPNPKPTPAPASPAVQPGGDRQPAPSGPASAPKAARPGVRGSLDLEEEPFSSEDSAGMEAALRRVAEQVASLSGRPPPPAGVAVDAVDAVAEGSESTRAASAPQHRHSLPPGSNPQSLARRFLGATALERQLVAALRSGAIEAGDRLLALLEAESGRQSDVVEVLRTMVLIAPGELGLLERLRQAALRDNDAAYAAALLHAVESLAGAAARTPPPPLDPQPVQSEVVLGLLRVGLEPALEALGLLWQHAMPLFRDDLDAVAERSPLPDDNQLWMATFSISRLLGSTRLRLWVHDSPNEQVGVVFDQPPGLVLDPGADWASTVFQYQLGQALLETRSELLLVRALPRNRLETLMAAVLAAFGPPRRLEGDVAGIAQLAERFWELLPPRVQRRLGELCERPEAFEYEQIQTAARAARRRCGLFVSGDLAVALGEVAREEGIELELHRQRGQAAELCQRHPAMADLVRLATSFEYAGARWRVERVVATDRHR